MDDFKLDARKWRFLDKPARYIEHESSGLKIEPLKRQFKTAKEILSRLADGRGVLLADDVGLGKTTVSALVAWAVACQDKRVRIYAPNDVLRRHWAEELERHVPMLAMIGARKSCIRQGDVERLRSGSIQVATHHALVRSHGNNDACDLMIIDEAHRAKGDGSAFNKAICNLGDRAKRKLILTATPFSIRLSELEQLLQFVGASKLSAVKGYSNVLKGLYELGDGHDVVVESKRLVSAAEAAIEELQPYLVRHGVDDLSDRERRHFGEISTSGLDIVTPPATPDDLELLLRMDRLLQLAPERKGERRNDPRFHIGWQHLGTELQRAEEHAHTDTDSVVGHHIDEAKASLKIHQRSPHPKIAAVSDAIRPLIDAGEKVLVFCHHRATASELLTALERALKTERVSSGGPPVAVWRAAWESLLPNEDDLISPIIDRLFCAVGVRAQVTQWLGAPKSTTEALAEQISKIRPRSAGHDVPTIGEAARGLVDALLQEQSTSTRALLKSISKGERAFSDKSMSHFPGRLDDGIRVMGAWSHDGTDTQPKTLYTGKPDIVLALFNSPFGPDVLVTTDRLSEGVDLHRCCRHLIHYELDPSPIRTLQRNGRIRRVGSWAALTGKPIQYAYPKFRGTRDEKVVAVMRQRIKAFGLLLGGVPQVEPEAYEDQGGSFAELVLDDARQELARLNRKLCVPKK